MTKRAHKAATLSKAWRSRRLHFVSTVRLLRRASVILLVRFPNGANSQDQRHAPAAGSEQVQQRVEVRAAARRIQDRALSDWAKELSYWSSARKAWVDEAEEFDVRVGSSSAAEARAIFKVAE